MHSHLGSHYGDEYKIMAIGRKYISSIKSNYSVRCANIESDIYQKKMSEVFHVRFIVKHTKVDTLLIVDLKLI
jgi:hypothetical protein